MSLSRVYKKNSGVGLQSVRFVEFGEQGAGVVPVSPEPFREERYGFPSQDRLAQRREISSDEPFREEMPPQNTADPETSPEPPPAPAPAPDLERQLEEAFARGRQAGAGQAGAGMNDAAQAFTVAIEEISRLRETLLKNSTLDMVRLVMAIAEQVIHCEVASKETAILETVKRALQASVSADEFRVRVNPEDFALVTERKPLFLASISGLENIVFEADPRIERGGCLVESELGEVDATIASQLEEIRQNLMEGILAA